MATHTGIPSGHVLGDNRLTCICYYPVVMSVVIYSSHFILSYPVVVAMVLVNGNVCGDNRYSCTLAFLLTMNMAITGGHVNCGYQMSCL